jgi:hypothetical protein
VCIPYVRGLSESIQRIGYEVNVRTVFSAKDTLRSRLIRTKSDKYKKNLNKGVVYSIPCECREEYIGETGRPLEVRVNEHKKNIEKEGVGYSKLVDHALSKKHQIQWKDVKILGRESQEKKREIFECLEMAKRSFNTISQPSFSLPPVWLPLINSNVPRQKCTNAEEKNRRQEGQGVTSVNLRRSKRLHVVKQLG